MPLLHPGVSFPTIPLNVGSETVTLPDAAAGHYAVVLFYRGSWCPYCKAQLRAFAAAHDALAEAHIRVYAASVDDEATTRALVDGARLPYPVGHSADPSAVAAATGAFLHTEPDFIQPTAAVLDRDGRVLVSVYSSGAIGRLVPDDVITMIAYVRSQATATQA